MPETYENWLGSVNNCAYYNRQTNEIYRVLPYSVDSKLPWSFNIQWVRQYLKIFHLE